MREPHEAAVVGGYRVPANSRVMLNVWSLHRSPEHFPQPEEFR